MYIKERLNLLEKFRWNILGCSDSHTIGDGWKPKEKSSLISYKEYVNGLKIRIIPK